MLAPRMKRPGAGPGGARRELQPWPSLAGRRAEGRVGWGGLWGRVKGRLGPEGPTQLCDKA